MNATAYFDSVMVVMQIFALINEFNAFDAKELQSC